MLANLDQVTLGKVVVKNTLSQFTSSENLLSGGYVATGGSGANFNTDATDELDLVATAGGIQIPIDSLSKTEDLTLSIDLWSPDISAPLLVKLFDGITAYIPDEGQKSIAIDTERKRYSVTVNTAGGFGANVTHVVVIYAAVQTGTLKASRIMVEKVTGKTNKNPSTYVPNSVSKQLNGFMQESDSSVPALSVANGCPLFDGTQDLNTTNSGWCWGSSTSWEITGNLLTSGAPFNSIHSKQFSSAGRYYDYQYTIGVVKLLVLPQICGISVASGQDAIGNHSGRVLASSVEQLFTGSSGLSAGGTISDVSIIECDPDTNTDGAQFRASYGDLTVDAVTKVVTE